MHFHVRLENSVDPDQMALSGAGWSGDTVCVFLKKKNKVLAQQDKG